MSRSGEYLDAGPARLPAVEDRLPPNDEGAELGIIACCLWSPLKCVPQVLEFFRGEEVFYGERNKVLLHAVLELHRTGKAVDDITLCSYLRDLGRLEEVGGYGLVATLKDRTPSAENLPYYLGIVWEKYLSRVAVGQAVEMVQQIGQWNGLTESLWGRVTRQWEEWGQKTQRHTGLPPKELQSPGVFGEELYGLVFKVPGAEPPGRPLPFELGDFRVRMKELTILAGDSETGKSTWLSEVAVHQALQGARVCIASFEMPCAKTLWLLVRQLLAVKELPDTTAARRTLTSALAWLHSRFWLYNFLGITDWRSLLDTFVYAQEKLGVDTFIIDNLGMIGIPEDDLSQQGVAAAQFATFAHTRNVHLFAITHVTKGEGNFKQRMRGSKRWTDFADNLFEWMRNEKKAEKLAESWAELCSGVIDQAAYSAKRQEMGTWWDAKCLLRKHRYGERHNGSRFLYFDTACKQFRGDLRGVSRKYLEESQRGAAASNTEQQKPQLTTEKQQPTLKESNEQQQHDDGDRTGEAGVD